MVRYIFLNANLVTFEVEHSKVDVFIHDVHSNEVAGRGVKPENTGLTTARGFLFSEIDDVTVFLQVHDQFGHGRNAQVHYLANICDSRIAIRHKEMDDFFL